MLDEDLKFDDTINCNFFFGKKISKHELENFCVNINSIVSSLSQGYIWNRDKFRVYVPLDLNENESNLHLRSVTCFGDNIEDEWLIVFLIYELSKLYLDMLVDIEDNDGCFLLIEAAEYLPTWLNPETAENRVYVHQNNLHIINPDLFSLENKLNKNDAIKIIIDNPEKTKATADVQNAIRKKISCYPQKIKDTLHKAIIKLPKNVAAVLKLKPCLISHLVNTYCHHDVLDEKICRKVIYEDCVDTQVIFTKYLYAMLLNAKLVKTSQIVNQKEKKSSLGFKLTCGFDIIMAQSNDVFASPEYKKFLRNLNKTGYFKDNIEGSKAYNELLDKAKSHFCNMECPLKSYVYNEISSVMINDSYYKMLKSFSKNNDSELSEDSDDWLNMSPDDLNEELTNRFGNNFTNRDDNISTPQGITAALTKFLDKQSDFEGIETTESNEIDFDPDNFTECLQKYLNIVTSSTNNDEYDYSNFEDDIGLEEIEEELNLKLCSKPGSSFVDVKKNLVQSVKEEGVTGPSSNILKTIGVNKTDLLDSDDDE